MCYFFERSNLLSYFTKKEKGIKSYIKEENILKMENTIGYKMV
jgi:hypothetical protein